ncbi:hypothetical protein F5051DRAFT_450536 [Lentinula edodes]|nr:hypothetical protein F5051DRAFT_450536 [Lentinula edodes]
MLSSRPVRRVLIVIERRTSLRTLSSSANSHGRRGFCRGGLHDRLNSFDSTCITPQNNLNPPVRRHYTSGKPEPEEHSQTDSSKKAEVDGMDLYTASIATAQTILSILDRAKQVWPSPKVPVPFGWSADWDCWDMLLSLYWTSPQYLMLPQIETIFNIHFGIRGETRPIVYSTPDLTLNQGEGEEEEGKREFKSFVFTVVERPSEFYLLEYHGEPTLFKISLPKSEDSSSEQIQQLTEPLLVELLATPDKLTFEHIEHSPEGSAALQRIFARDRDVIPELEKFLGYIPEHTEIWEENPQNSHPEYTTKSAEMGESSEKTAEDEKIAEVNYLLKEIEERSPEFKEASQAWDRGMLDVSSSMSDNEIDPDSVEHSMSAIGLKEEIAQLEDMMDNADGEISKLDESLQETLTSLDTKSVNHESLSPLQVEVDEANEDHVRLSVPFKEERGKDPKSG